MKFDVTINSEQVAQKMVEKKTRLNTVLAAKIEFLDAMLVRYIVEEKLNGQVLKQREGGGGLTGSIRTDSVVENNGVIEGGVLGGGGTAPYAKYQEYGTTPGQSWVIEPKNAKALAFMPLAQNAIVPLNKQMVLSTLTGIKAGSADMVQSRKKFSQLGGVIVKKVIHPPLQERSFMRSSLNDKADEIVKGIQDAISEAIQ